MKLLFVADPLATFKTYKDSTFAMMREAALITFLVTLSGLSLGGVGSAFWGLVAGGLALFVQQWRPRSRRDPPLP